VILAKLFNRHTNGAETAKHLVRQGNKLLGNGSLPEAAAKYEEALAADASNTNASVNLGFVLKELGKTDAAKKYLERAIQIDPQLGDAHYLLGLLAESQNDLEAGIRHLENAVKLKPDFPVAWKDLGRVYFLSGRIKDARFAIEKGIALDPQLAELHLYLGNIHHHEKAYLPALTCYEMALSINPDFAEAHTNRGCVLQALKRLEEALESHDQAIRINPDFADAHFNLGTAYMELKRLDDALESYDHAIRIKSDYAEAYFKRGNTLKALGKLDQAVVSYQKALLLKPDDGDAYVELGNALCAQGKLEEAAERYRQAIKLDPLQYDGIEHLISAFTGKNTERPPSQYIEKLFDGYADEFDKHLTQKLCYQIPKELASLLKRTVDLPLGELDVLDLGCGTGLSGLEFAPYARQLVGVDLSGKMLEKAQSLNIYSRLEHSDLLTMMKDEEGAKYDVIIAADVFIYIGQLEDIMSEARRLLRTGGYFMFSVETHDELSGNSVDSENIPEYKLNQTGRYAHSASYLKNLALANSFSILNLDRTQIRIERSMPVTGWVALWQH
jgi:predicted TPR repeat methyltransferase